MVRTYSQSDTQTDKSSESETKNTSMTHKKALNDQGISRCNYIGTIENHKKLHSELISNLPLPNFKTEIDFN